MSSNPLPNYGLSRVIGAMTISAFVAIGVVQLFNSGHRHENPPTPFDYKAAHDPVPPDFVTSSEQAVAPAAAPAPHTEVAELPPITAGAGGYPQWFAIDGLILDGSSLGKWVDGQPILSLRTARTTSVHRIGVRYGRVEAGRPYRITFFIRPLVGSRFWIEVGDSNHYDVQAALDLNQEEFKQLGGDPVRGTGFRHLVGGWVKTWIDFNGTGGVMGGYIGLLNTTGERTYKGDEVTRFDFGGLDLQLINDP